MNQRGIAAQKVDSQFVRRVVERTRDKSALRGECGGNERYGRDRYPLVDDGNPEFAGKIFRGLHKMFRFL